MFRLLLPMLKLQFFFFVFKKLQCLLLSILVLYSSCVYFYFITFICLFQVVQSAFLIRERSIDVTSEFAVQTALCMQPARIIEGSNTIVQLCYLWYESCLLLVRRNYVGVEECAITLQLFVIVTAVIILTPHLGQVYRCVFVTKHQRLKKLTVCLMWTYTVDSSLSGFGASF